MKKAPPTKRTSRRALGPIVRKFKENVRFIIEWQGYPVSVVRLPYPPLDEMKSDQDAFTPRRVLLNPAIVGAKNRELLISEFNPPIELRIAYTFVDLKFAQNQSLEHPQVGFWDGSKWVLFTVEKHDLRWVPARRGTKIAGYAVVRLSNWSDPAIGMGPP